MTKKQTETAKPNQYCCEGLEYAVKICSITYDGPLEEFRLIRVKGVGGQYLNYCPWCGEDIFSLRAFRISKHLEYGEELKYGELDRYWHIIKQDLNHEETLRLIAEEKAKGKTKKRGGN
jgi:hypothetical protein